ncbi:Fe2+-dependent dioxygenase [Pseudooceanicola sp.]|uniref:Fe2+-dependent dioxygenase n=1 Tax=Pseudooceanicola sp. TaxID=1914328 RepID=UPI00261F4114|nr:Fe2+-dependent dioxygenase [Pseudooceanicola sp.]MDF1855995.1 Fe2+-dependent dioxygenase [Pseudooceanicola sp.]
MPVVLSDLLSSAETEVLHAAALDLDFADGAGTAGSLARGVKDNLQAVDSPASAALLDKVQAALLRHPLFQALCYPKGFARMLVSCTEGGGRYGEHVDNAVMAGMRADVSFTLFLTPTDDYDGGALTISDHTEDRSFRLNPGEMIVYPSNTLHRVDPVTRGRRLAIVGWVSSWVADPRGREVLFDLWQAMAAAEAGGDLDQARRISKARSNLLRMWAA